MRATPDACPFLSTLRPPYKRWHTCSQHPLLFHRPAALGYLRLLRSGAAGDAGARCDGRRRRALRPGLLLPAGVRSVSLGLVVGALPDRHRLSRQRPWPAAGLSHHRPPSRRGRLRYRIPRQMAPRQRAGSALGHRAGAAEAAWRLSRLLARVRHPGVHQPRLRRPHVRRRWQPAGVPAGALSGRRPDRLAMRVPRCGAERPPVVSGQFLHRATPPERPRTLRGSARFARVLARFPTARRPARPRR